MEVCKNKKKKLGLSCSTDLKRKCKTQPAAEQTKAHDKKAPGLDTRVYNPERTSQQKKPRLGRHIDKDKNDRLFISTNLIASLITWS